MLCDSTYIISNICKLIQTKSRLEFIRGWRRENGDSLFNGTGFVFGVMNTLEIDSGDGGMPL